MKCPRSKKHRTPQGKGKDHVGLGIRGHSWKLDEDGLRKCKECGYAPPTQRIKGSHWKLNK